MSPGGTIGAYRIVKKLGEGAMGMVYLGEHVLLGRQAAIKVLRPARSVNEGAVQRFFNEARAVARVPDPGIVQIFDFGFHTDGSGFIVMELLDGEAMDQRLKRIGRFGQIEGLRLSRLICISLGVAHAKGIVHRDLKPENLFLIRDPAAEGGERVKILDFGIAKLSLDEPGMTRTSTGTLMGTPVYMSPEQCSGAGDLDHRSDIYSIGCVMFTMLTGRPPFTGPGSGDLIASHLLEPPPRASSRVPELPPAVDDLLDRCLRKSPGDRYPSMAALVDAIGVAERSLDRSSSAAAPSAAPVLEPMAAPGPGGDASLGGLTTLSGASGQMNVATWSPRLRRQGWIRAVAGAGAIAIGAAIPLLVMQHGGDARRPAAPSRAAGGNIAPSPRDPPAAAAPPAASASAEAAVQVVPDAGIPDAAPSPEPTESPTHPPKPHGQPLPPPSKRGDHAGSTRASRPPIDDRGD